MRDVKSFSFCKCLDSYRKEKVHAASEDVGPADDVTGGSFLGRGVAVESRLLISGRGKCGFSFSLPKEMLTAVKEVI